MATNCAKYARCLGRLSAEPGWFLHDFGVLRIHDNLLLSILHALSVIILGRFVVDCNPSIVVVVQLDNFPQTRDANENARRVMTYADRVRALALSFPQTYEDAPWGFPVFKVGANKLFAWMSEHGENVDVTLKLSAEEREIAELLPWVRRASHVGRYGWVTATIEDADALETALEWLRESYYLKAPAKLRDAAFAD